MALHWNFVLYEIHNNIANVIYENNLKTLISRGSGRIHKYLQKNLETLGIWTLLIIMKSLHGKLPALQGLWLHIYNYLYSYKPMILHRRRSLITRKVTLSLNKRIVESLS